METHLSKYNSAFCNIFVSKTVIVLVLIGLSVHSQLVYPNDDEKVVGPTFYCNECDYRVEY